MYFCYLIRAFESRVFVIKRTPDPLFAHVVTSLIPRQKQFVLGMAETNVATQRKFQFLVYVVDFIT